jgi:hypothetical protein
MLTKDREITEISRELIEDKVLNWLNTRIEDLSLLTDEHLPIGYPKYQVWRESRYLGNVTEWGDGKYYTRIVHNPAGYDTVYQAATCWVSRKWLAKLEEFAVKQLKLQRIDIDYM